MYDVIVDMDGILMISPTERFSERDTLIKNPYLYDIKKNSLGIAGIYKNTNVDWDCIRVIRYFASLGHKVLVYTESNDFDVFLAKQSFFSHWFSYVPNVYFKSMVPNYTMNNNYSTNVVVSCNRDFLALFDNNVCKFCVDSFSNSSSIDDQLDDILKYSDIISCSGRLDAIERAFARAMVMRALL